ncbi:hypothetical protein F2Q70_00003096 [Brassica cretica]|uniref:Uncharacterized protein n=1 Tax=Brassica cretica TaxID=69181 RepID=A0A8S9J4Q8_BRACR|nr:hypothetical protein F2Q70_00003096 [Brassica cretica]
MMPIMISPAKAINIILEPAKAMVQCYQVSNIIWIPIMITPAKAMDIIPEPWSCQGHGSVLSSLKRHAANISPSQQFRSLCCNRHETTLVKGHDSPPMAHDRGHSYPSRDHILMVQSLINTNQVSITRSLWNGRCNASVHHTIRTDIEEAKDVFIHDQTLPKGRASLPPSVPMKLPFYTHLPSRLSQPLEEGSVLLSSSIIICGLGGSPGVPAKARTFLPYIGEGVLSDSLNHVLDHDTLVFRSYGLTGVSPRTKVCPDDTIQDRGCYRDEERWRSNDLCVCECSGSSNCGSGDGGMLPSCLTERPEDIRFVFLTLEASSC